MKVLASSRSFASTGFDELEKMKMFREIGELILGEMSELVSGFVGRESW